MMKNKPIPLAKRKIHFCFVTLFIFTIQSFAQEQLLEHQKDHIDSLVNIYMTKNRIPGVSVAITKKGQVVLERSYGMANLESNAPATPSTIYRLASVSKPITAVAVMQLVEEGKIDLDSEVQKYVPSFPEKEYPVTVRDLLSHMSGIRHYRGEEFLLNQQYSDLTEALSIFKEDTLLHKPGLQQTYSTYGYTLLGAIVESVTGQSFMDYLKEEVFQPANMTNTMADDPRKIILNRSANYDTVASGTVVNSVPVNTSYKIPGGGILSTAGDMANFLIGLQKNSLVNKESWTKMTTEVYTEGGEPTHYGLGWILGIPPFPGFPNLPQAVWHGGVQQGSTTAILLLPNEEIGVVLLSNSGGFGDDVTLTTALIAAELKEQ